MKDKAVSKLRCKDVMSRPVQTCRENATVAECASLMKKFNLGFLPVVDDERRAVGVITDRDLATRVLAKGMPPKSMISPFMTSLPLLTCQPKDALVVAETKMRQSGVSRVLIVDDSGRPLGVVGLTDIALSEKRKRTGALLGAVKRQAAAAARKPFVSRAGPPIEMPSPRPDNDGMAKERSRSGVRAKPATGRKPMSRKAALPLADERSAAEPLATKQARRTAGARLTAARRRPRAPGTR